MKYKYVPKKMKRSSFFTIVISIAISFALAGMSIALERGIKVERIKDLSHESGNLGEYKALIIGISDYKGPKIPDLETPINDATAIAKVLKEKYGFKVRLLLDREATKEAIYKGLRNLAASTRPNDSVLIYFAGHGDLDRTYNDGWWIPVDAIGGNPVTYLDNIQVQKAMRSMKARHVLLISDSCYSGTLFGKARSLPRVIDDKYYLSLYNEKSRWGMTSGNKTPVSDQGTGGHSVFAYQLIKELEKNDKPFLSTQEIYTRIAPVIANNSEQTPLCRPIVSTGDQGGEFVFVASVKNEPPKTIPNVHQSTIDKETVFWQSIEDSEDSALFEVYIERFPNGFFAPIAKRKIEALKQKKVIASIPVESSKSKLFVEVEPRNAGVKILNIKPKFYQGIELRPGRYHVEVSAGKYKTWEEWVDLSAGEERRIQVTLNPIPEPVRASKLAAPSAGDTWKDPITSMEFVWVPGGCFMMGQTESEKQYLIRRGGEKTYDKLYKHELPRHRVCVDGFWMGRYEVTRGQFRYFVRETGYRTDAEKKGKAQVFNKKTDGKWKELPGYDWKNVGYSQNDSHPVAGISWNDAKAFADWISRKTGRKIQLPTEAQWEYAAWGGVDAMRFWGSDDSDACRYANAADKGHWRGGTFPCDDGYKFTAPAGNYRPNHFGLYDMLGNVWEWCADWHGDDYYSRSPKNNPQGPSRGRQRVLRGGGWGSAPELVRAANRLGSDLDLRSTLVGFRLVLLPPQ